MFDRCRGLRAGAWPALRLFALLACASTAACNINPYRLGASADDGGFGDGDGGPGTGDAGPANGDGGPSTGDGGPSNCNPSQEICDDADNDCDGDVDEDFNLDADPANCGGCGITCDRPNSSGSCVSGACDYDCLPGFHDVDQDDPSDGCEYFCIETNGGVEICDLADNNCDGTFDQETFDLDNDVNNCGACGRACNPLNATPLCDSGTCSYVPGSCAPGYNDVNPAILGCEYQCPDGDVGGPELCNGIDDDCDGKTDEDVNDPNVGVACFARDGGGNDLDEGVCGANPGTTQCVFGNITCQGPTSPGIEQCDGGSNPAVSDEDCDGSIDEGFDLDNDVNNCGTCGNQCAFDHAVAQCNGSGVCEIAACQTGYTDDPDVPGSDCDYQCTITGAEVCDGIDNDCDKLVDADDSDTFANGGMYVPPNFCSQAGACNGATVVCGTEQDDGVTPDCDTSTVTYRCQYPGTAETLCGGFRVASQESLCDDADNDCDVAVDESFPSKGDYCDSSDVDVGECIQTGELACNGSLNGVECTYTGGGTGTPGGPEPCDARDNDCDGSIDEEPDDSSYVVEFTSPPSGLAPFAMYKFEASRPDATASDAGFSEDRACSKPDALPWGSVSWIDADLACSMIPGPGGTTGTWRLCSQEEWQLACAGASTACAVNSDDCSGDQVCNDDGATKLCAAGSGANVGGACSSDDDCDDDPSCTGGEGDCDGKCVSDGVTIYPDGNIRTCRYGSSANVGQECDNDDDCDSGGNCSNNEDDCDNKCRTANGVCAADSPANAGGLCRTDSDCDDDPFCSDGESDCEDTCQPERRYHCLAGSGANVGGICTSDDECDDNPSCTSGEADCEGMCGPLGTCGRLYPYGSSYDPFACNGHDYDSDFDGATCELNANDDGPLPTGSAYGCTTGAGGDSDTECATPEGVDDLSGNLKEWTGTTVGTNARVFGGAYDNEQQALSCDFDFLILDQDFALPNLGFRCCKDL